MTVIQIVILALEMVPKGLERELEVMEIGKQAEIIQTTTMSCKVPLTVKHILINCDWFRRICPKHYQTNNLKNLFKNSKPEENLSFLKEINFFIKI